MKRLGSRRIYRAWLVPYTEGTLDPACTAALEARLARDPALAAEAEALRAVASRLRQSAQGVASDADPRLSLAPSPLWPGIRARLVPPRPRPAPRPLWAGGLCAAMLVLVAWLWHGPASPPRQMPLPAPMPLRAAVNLPVPGADSPRRVRHAPRRAAGYAHMAKRRLPTLTRAAALPRRLLARGETPKPDDKAPLPSAAALPADAPQARPAVQISGTPTRFRLASPLRDTPRVADPARPVPWDVPGTTRQPPAAPTEAPGSAQSEAPNAPAVTTAVDGDSTAPTRAVLHRPHRRHARRRHGHRTMPASKAPADVPASAPVFRPTSAPSHNPAST